MAWKGSSVGRGFSGLYLRRREGGFVVLCREMCLERKGCFGSRCFWSGGIWDLIACYDELQHIIIYI